MKGEPVSVQTVPTIIAGARSDLIGTTTEPRPNAGQGNVSLPTAALIRNIAGGGTVYLGGQNVTTATGCPFYAGEDLEQDFVNEILYGVVATSSTTLYVLRRGD